MTVRQDFFCDKCLPLEQFHQTQLCVENELKTLTKVIFIFHDDMVLQRISP